MPNRKDLVWGQNQIDRQRELTDIFEFYRRGKWYQWQGDERERLYKKRRVKRGRWRGHRSGARGVRGQAKLEEAKPFVSADRGGYDSSLAAVTRANPILAPFRVAFGGMLGWGGAGACARYELLDAEGGKIRDIVAKFDLRPDPDSGMGVASEKLVTRLLRRTDYCLQEETIPRPHIRRAANGEPSKVVVVMAKSPNDRKDLLLLEYMRRGDLTKWIWRKSQRKKRWTNAQLWELFNSLYQAVLEMHFPPSRQPGFKANPDVRPLRRIRTSYELIHYDLDPSNVLVGDFDPQFSHNLMPRVKVADFGISDEVRVLKQQDFIWEERLNGKMGLGYMLPEQFHPEWDYVQTIPYWEDPQPKVAGNLSWKSNLYQAGAIMWAAVTGLHPFPDPEPYAPNANGQSRYTYGRPRLLLAQTYGQYDIDLRRLIIRCMMDEPDDRPSLDDMDMWMAKKCTGIQPNDDDPDFWNQV